MQIQIDCPEKLIPFFQKKKRIKIVVGGRGSAKSTGLADGVAAHVSNGKKVGCLRELQNSIEESVHSSIKSSIARLKLPNFTIQKNRIEHVSGGYTFYKGIARNPNSVKSSDSVDLYWVEEAESLSEESITKLLPTARKAAGQETMPELWFSANRGSSKDAFSQMMLKPYEKELKKNGYYEDDIRLIIELNWRDNPWFIESGLNEQRLSDKETMSPAKYRHVWEGDYDDDVDDSIIKPEWFDACVDAHIKKGFKPLGAEVVAFDPSDTGGDAKGLAYRHGVVFKDVLEWESGDVNDALDLALDYAIDKKVDLFVWDGDGLGAPLRRDVGKALDDKKIDWYMFKGSESPDNPDKPYLPDVSNNNETFKQKAKTNKETFRNKRAQRYINLRDRCYKTYESVIKGVYHDPEEMISFSSDMQHLDLLRSELCRIPLKPTLSGLLQIMDKQSMKRMGIDSPNMADAVMMAMELPKKKRKERKKINYRKLSIA